MDDIFSKINELLKNPEAVEQIKSIASGVSGNTGEYDSKTVFAQ